MKTFSTFALALAVAVTSVAGSAQAQVKDENEILRQIEKQRELQNSSVGTPASDSGTSRTRGITYFPDDDNAQTGSGGAIVAPAATDQQASTGTTIQRQTTTTARANTGSRYTQPTRPTPAAVRVPELPKGSRLDLVILFEYNSAFIRPASRPQLSELCKAIAKAGPTDKFTIVGHTDSSGSNSYNMGLSEARAAEVKRHLVTECNIPGERLRAVGMGEERLDDSFQPRSEKQRRVEIQLNLS